MCNTWWEGRIFFYPISYQMYHFRMPHCSTTWTTLWRVWLLLWQTLPRISLRLMKGRPSIWWVSVNPYCWAIGPDLVIVAYLSIKTLISQLKITLDLQFFLFPRLLKESTLLPSRWGLQASHSWGLQWWKTWQNLPTKMTCWLGTVWHVQLFCYAWIYTNGSATLMIPLLLHFWMLVLMAQMMHFIKFFNLWIVYIFKVLCLKFLLNFQGMFESNLFH